MSTPQEFFHQRLSNGVELAIERLPGRRTVACDIRMLTGLVDEPDELLGLAHITEQTISKGTAEHSGQALSDAFDAMGIQHASWVGRESFGFRYLCLPEYVGPAFDLHAEMLRLPSFPDESCQVAVALAGQELTALEDEPDELARRELARQAYGSRLGRHALGNARTLRSITRDHVSEFWRTHFGAARLQVVLAGPLEPSRVVDQLERSFAGFGNPPDDGRLPRPIEFSPVRTHRHKELEQEQIHMCWPGVPVQSDEFAVERVLLAILSEGMSSRLFVEVREKLGLVYWVGAWHEHPRSGGMIFVGASTTPQRCDETFGVLLREVDRLAEDITEDELRRAKRGLIARTETHGDITRAHAAELASDLFYFGRPRPMAAKIAQIEAVTADDVRGYLSRHPRDRLSVVTLGPRELKAAG
ncbi:MAG: insulinase family protein [Phycisphaerae bacterium]|nr:insulinase family protein [Phycisphaerae bacterium]NUQ47613.1 insulinase family protein [Phycisphaerae bacterium]